MAQEIEQSSIHTEIKHRFIESNGIKMHVAEQGSGPLVLLIHGFPELWYTWRHQITALAKAGYHAVAPDLRGYGQTEVPHGVEKYTTLHIVGDLVGLLDALNVKQAFVVGHDWGAAIAWDLCLFRPDRVKAHVSLSVPFSPKERAPMTPVQGMKALLGEGFYICRFQEPGRAEADFARFDVKTVMKKFLLISKPDMLIAPKDKEISDILDIPKDLPPWINEEDFDYYAENFSKTGFTGGLNYYRAIDLSSKLKAPWTGAKVDVPTLFIMGDKDVVGRFPWVEGYLRSGGFQKDVPNLKCVILPGIAHFLQEEASQEVGKLINDFLVEHK